MKRVEGGVTSAMGYKAASIGAEIRYENREDLALIVSDVPAIFAGTFTKNIVKAAPVKWDMNILDRKNRVKGIVVNSGIANACTGKQGDLINEKMASCIAENMDIKTEQILTASTGIIGEQIPIEKIENKSKKLIGELSGSVDAGTKASKAIMTTDTFNKECAYTFKIDNKNVVIGGMTKGSGMIHPDMATMLCFITTDILISQELLQEALDSIVKDSFNMISVDRDTSTNDSCILLANGLASNEIINYKSKHYETFVNALGKVAIELAKMIASDGEGATKLIEVNVINCKSKDNAVAISKSIVSSNLVKTMVFGNETNCGRIVCAIGYSGVDFILDNIELFIENKFEKVHLFSKGIFTQYDEEKVIRILKGEKVIMTVDMLEGKHYATAWGCDLTYDYIKINADYKS